MPPKKDVPSTKAQRRAQAVLRDAEATKRHALASGRRPGAVTRTIDRQAIAALHSAMGVARAKGHHLVATHIAHVIAQSKSSDPRGHLSVCVVAWMQLLLNPWMAPPPMVCFPDTPCMETVVVQVFARGIMVCCTASPRGFIAVNPYSLIANDNGVNTYTNAIWYTNGAGSAITTFPPPPTTGVVGVESNSPYGVADIGPAFERKNSYRLLSAGVKICDRGDAQGLGGTAVPFISPLNGFSDVTWTRDNLEAYSTTQTLPVEDGEWIQAIWTPKTVEDRHFRDTIPTTSSTEAGPMIISVSAATVSRQFQFDVCATFEVLGESVRGASRKMADPIGGAAATQVVSNLQDKLNTVKETVAAGKSMYTRTLDVLEGFSAVGKGIVNGAKALGLMGDTASAVGAIGAMVL